MSREELLQKAKTSRPAVTVFGLGGAGCNIATWIADKKLTGGRIVAANTDANHLVSMTRADKIMLLGEKLCKGHGCGGYPERGAQAARDNLSEIKQELEGTNLLFLVAGLGGGSGTGAMPVVAAAGREAGALTIACVTIPFTIEMSRREKARDELLGGRAAKRTGTVGAVQIGMIRRAAVTRPIDDVHRVAFLQQVLEPAGPPVGSPHPVGALPAAAVHEDDGIRMADLGRWLGGEYRVPGPAVDPDDEPEESRDTGTRKD